MEAVAFVCVLLGALLTGLYRPIQKQLFEIGVLTEQEALVIQCACASVFALLGLAIIQPLSGWEPPRPDAALFWGALALTTFANAYIQYFRVRAYYLGTVSTVTPIASLTPGLVALAALALGELPSLPGWIGIALIISGAYLHSRTGRDWRDYLRPFWFLFAQTAQMGDKERAELRALRYAYASAVLGTFGLIGDALLARHGNLFHGITLQFAILAGLFATVLRSPEQRTLPNAAARMCGNVAKIAALGFCYGFPLVLFSMALALAPVAYIGSLKRLSIVVSVALAIWWLRETPGPLKIATTLMITAGAILLALDPTDAVVIDSAGGLLGALFN